MTALSEDLQALLDAERDIDVPALAQRKRILERLEPLLLVPIGLAAASAVSTAGTAGAASMLDTVGGNVLGGALKLKIAAAVVSAALLGGAVGVAGHAYVAAAAPPSVVAPTVPRPPRAPQLPPEPATHPPQDQPALMPSAAPSAPPPVASPRERPHAPSSLRAERLLIETATAALMRGDGKSAISALRRHARQFPHGDLAQEREVLLTKALAAQKEIP